MTRKLLFFAALASLALTQRGHAADTSCTSSPTTGTVTYAGSTLQTSATTLAGVAYAGTELAMVPVNLPTVLKETSFTITDSAGASEEQIKWACSADFDKDGYPDLIGVKKLKNTIGFYKNLTATNVPSQLQWNDPTYVRPPVFRKPSSYIYTGTAQTTVASEKVGLACGDVNKDGNPDFFYLRCDGATSGDDAYQCLPTVYDLYLGNGAGGFTRYAGSLVGGWQNVTLSQGYKGSINQNIQMLFKDVDSDGWPDLVVPAVLSANGNKTPKWALEVYRNNHASPPSFDFQQTLLRYADTGAAKNAASGGSETGLTSFVFKDLDGNGTNDLLVGATAFAATSGYASPATGDLTATTRLSLTMPAPGGTTLSPGVILAGDFSASGRQDVVVGFSSFFATSGHVHRWSHTGSAAWPTYAVTGAQVAGAQTTRKNVTAGFVLNYDSDPYTTDDFVLFDGDNGGAAGAPTYWMFATRRVPAKYPASGSAASAAVDLGALAAQDVAITGVRIHPTFSLGGGALAFEASNDDGVTYLPAAACADDATSFCVTFTTTAGAKLRWRALFTANAALDGGPRLSQVQLTYQYVVATNHFRASPVARDGLVYAAAFSEPGDSGHLFAIDDASSTTLWDAGRLLDGNTSRNVTTASSAGALLTFSTASASNTALQATLGAASATEAATIIGTILSARFGASIPHVLGAIVNSTPAVLSHPGTAYWWPLATTSTTDRSAIDAFVAANATRPILVFAGGKDGALHAFRTNPANPSDTSNGKEAWAFIPYDVARRMKADATAGKATAYPDGAPTIADAKVGGAWRTLLVSGEGSGGQAVYALDVTSTVNATTGAVTAPLPKWSFTDGNMGYTFSKPTVIRVSSGGVEKFLAVFASGKGPSGSDVGDSVYAVDIATGALVWRFDLDDSDCYVSTDIVATETTELDAGGAEVFDGFIDRIFFGDSKGRVWMIDPAAYTASHTISSLGTVDVGLAQRAFFSTRLTTGALGEDRAVAGAMAAIRDGSGHLTLYLATGGTDDTPASAQNAVYAVNGDDGSVALSYGAAQGVAAGVKFYGGVLFNGTQLIFAGSTDAIDGGLCSATTGEIHILSASDFSEVSTIRNVAIGSAVRAPIFVRNGELYTTTNDGKVVTTSYSGAGQTGTGPTQVGSADNGGAVSTFRLIGWRQL